MMVAVGSIALLADSLLADSLLSFDHNKPLEASQLDTEAEPPSRWLRNVANPRTSTKIHFDVRGRFGEGQVRLGGEGPRDRKCETGESSIS